MAPTACTYPCQGDERGVCGHTSQQGYSVIYDTGVPGVNATAPCSRGIYECLYGSLAQQTFAAIVLLTKEMGLMYPCYGVNGEPGEWPLRPKGARSMA